MFVCFIMAKQKRSVATRLHDLNPILMNCVMSSQVYQSSQLMTFHLLFRNQLFWRLWKLQPSKNMIWKADLLLEQGQTRIYSLAVVGFYLKGETCFTHFLKFYALMALTRQIMKADH